VNKSLPNHKIKRIGLTGSIGTGKSTAANILRGLGVPVIDADELAKRVVSPGQPALNEIRNRFGKNVINPEGTLNRESLAKVVFENPQALADLNAIVHPRVSAEASSEFTRLLESSTVGFAVYDVPLLYETGMEKQFDLVVVVHTAAALQLGRIMARATMVEAQAKARIAAQLDIDEKAKRSDWVIDNNGSREDLEAEVESFVDAIIRHNDKYPKAEKP